MAVTSQKAGSQSMVWGHPLPFWDTLGFWLMIAGAVIGAIALLITLASSVILYRVTSEQQAQMLRETSASAERTAQLEKETAETRLEYERLKSAVAWRALAPDQLPILTRLLGARSSTVQLEYVKADPESQRLAAQLWQAFRSAGWKVVLKAKTPLGAAAGIWILPNATPGEITTAAVDCVRNAFREIGLPYASTGVPAMEPSIGETWGPNSPPVKVIVGSKPEPDFP